MRVCDTNTFGAFSGQLTEAQERSWSKEKQVRRTELASVVARRDVHLGEVADTRDLHICTDAHPNSSSVNAIFVAVPLRLVDEY